MWCERVWTRCMLCAGPTNSSRGFCCAGLPLRAAGLDQVASPVARGSALRSGSASYVIADYVQAVEAAEARRDRLTAQIEAMLPDGALAPVVAALQTMRHGIGQCGNTDRRTGRPLALRQSAPAHGLSRAGAVRAFQRCECRRGGLTKAGNSAARRLLIGRRGSTASRPGSAVSCCSGKRDSPSRSARSPGRRSFGCARAIASSPAPANRPM
jgi:hypothetical protein